MKALEAIQAEQAGDEKIAGLVAGGDIELFGELIKRYEPKLFRYARKFLSDSDDIKDVVQKIFLKVYENIQSFDVSRRFSPWIYRIAHNELVNSLKEKQKRALPLFDLDTFLPRFPFASSLSEQMENGELKEVLNECLDQLQPKYKEPIILYYLEGLAYKEVAEVLQVPLATVGVRIKRAKALLKSLYQNHKKVYG
jgi:RNA polymerase sigma-70 factor (ECF subfamily)